MMIVTSNPCLPRRWAIHSKGGQTTTGRQTSDKLLNSPPRLPSRRTQKGTKKRMMDDVTCSVFRPFHLSKDSNFYSGPLGHNDYSLSFLRNIALDSNVQLQCRDTFYRNRYSHQCLLCRLRPLVLLPFPTLNSIPIHPSRRIAFRLKLLRSDPTGAPTNK
jgi:hypothetical protein